MTTAPTVLMNTVRSHWRLVVGSTALLMSWQACESLVPVVIGSVIDRAITRHDGRELLVWIGVLAGLFLVLSLSFRFGSRLSERASERAAHQLRVQVAGVVLDPHR
jgi:putative ABC transport system ATP-binding protein